MSLMDWNPEQFDVLVDEMNAQHERLVQIMNHLYDRHAAGADKAELDRILIQLRDYTLKHFREEEAWFDSIGFPEANTHKRIHEELVGNFVKNYEEFAAGSGEISQGFFDFLKLWLTAHIMHIDRKYGNFSQQRGAA